LAVFLSGSAQALPNQNMLSITQTLGTGRALAQVQVELAPPVGVSLKQDRADSANALMAGACLLVTRAAPLGSLTPDQEKDTLANAAELGVEPMLYFVSVASGWREAHPSERMPANSACGQWAVRQVNAHRAAAAAQYGYFDVEAISKLTGQAEPAAMLNSEKLACEVVLGARLRKCKEALSRLYEDRELGLDPAWLATEPTYWRWVTGDSVPPSKELRQHRRRAKFCLPKACSLCAVRSRIVLTVLTDVLLRNRVDPRQFDWPESIESAPRLWFEIADLVNAAGSSAS
jgi:hypothetical protein